jgi:hypothetical protein
LSIRFTSLKFINWFFVSSFFPFRDRHDCMVVGFTTTCAINAHHH